MDNFDLRKYLAENKLLNENLFSKAKEIIGDKILNSTVVLSALDKFTDEIISKMSKEDIANFKSKFNLNEAIGVPSLEDIFNKVHSANPDKNMMEAIIDKEKDPIYYKVVNLIRNLTGLNLMALAGAPFGLFMGYILDSDVMYRAEGIMAILISMIGSTIIHSISRKLIGLSDDRSLVGDD